MHSYVRIVALVLLAPAAFGAQPDNIKELAWLEGTWRGTHDGISMEERWTGVSGGALLGVHHDVKGGRMTSFEFMRIAATPEGVFYFASPRAMPPVAFKLTAMSERRVTFENKAHDFPQRIHYWLGTDGRLHARIEGPLQGKEVSEEWSWQRADAPASCSNTSHMGTTPPG